MGQGVVVGENCKLRRVILDAYNVVPPNTVIGYNRDIDAERYHLDGDSGIVVLSMPKIQLRKNLRLPLEDQITTAIEGF